MRVETAGRADTGIVASSVGLRAGPLDWEVLHQSLREVHGLGGWDTVDFLVEGPRDHRVLTIAPRPAAHAPSRIRTGVVFGTEFAGDSSFGLRVGWVVTPIGRLHGDWKTDAEIGRRTLLSTELYQPLESKERFFVAPSLGWDRFLRDVFVDDEVTARYFDSRLYARLDAGLALGPLGEIRVGVLRDRSRFSAEIGDPVLDDATADRAGAVFLARFDQLDNATIPRSGWAATVGANVYGEILGGDWAYDKVSATVMGARSFGEWTVHGGVRGLRAVRRDDAPALRPQPAGRFREALGPPDRPDLRAVRRRGARRNPVPGLEAPEPRGERHLRRRHRGDGKRLEPDGGHQAVEPDLGGEPLRRRRDDRRAGLPRVGLRGGGAEHVLLLARPAAVRGPTEPAAIAGRAVSSGVITGEATAPGRPVASPVRPGSRPVPLGHQRFQHVVGQAGPLAAETPGAQRVGHRGQLQREPKSGSRAVGLQGGLVHATILRLRKRSRPPARRSPVGGRRDPSEDSIRR